MGSVMSDLGGSFFFVLFDLQGHTPNCFSIFFSSYQDSAASLSTAAALGAVTPSAAFSKPFF